jgi:hypothetical protein
MPCLVLGWMLAFFRGVRSTNSVRRSFHGTDLLPSLRRARPSLSVRVNTSASDPDRNSFSAAFGNFLKKTFPLQFIDDAFVQEPCRIEVGLGSACLLLNLL